MDTIIDADTRHADTQPPPADAPFSTIATRRHQMFPVLADDEIDRLRRFGEIGHWREGDLLFRTGEAGPGMFVLLSGMVKIFQRDGLGRERLIAVHGRGVFLAEVGQLSGGPALVDGVALEPVDALLIRPEQLRAAIVAEAELGERIVRSLILRRVSLIEKGAGGPILVGRHDDPALLALQGFLSRNAHPYSVLDERDESMRCVIDRFAARPEDLPLVICPDGSVLHHPAAPELATCLGLLPELDGSRVYDVAVVGAGPAGLATAVYAASEGLSVIVLDARAPGGQAGASSRIENYLGFPTGISGQALAGRAFVQAQKFGAHIAIPVKVKSLRCDAYPRRLETGSGNVCAHTVVIASGAVYRRPALTGLDRLEGRGIYYWASPVEAKLCKQENVVLVGGGNSAGQAIVYLSSHVRHIDVLIRKSGFESTMSRYLIDRIASLPNVSVHPRAEIGSLDEDDAGLASIRLKSPGADGTRQFDARHLFLFTGANPNTDWLSSCGVALDANGFVLTGNGPGGSTCDLATSVEGVYAIGDARAGSTKRVAAAVGEGAAVVSQIHQLLAAMTSEAATARA
ncbi:cyclic nucleotide-regulated FAD-dependent pyridine nucleotide-disulfide oxidoreductase [Paraburkholderia caballeronis]|uniref:FAD-dependent oxidoreductase n=1 Tax=Paraburkholderia caballeronis TaxID=416943 RepID=UPI001066CABB|nr:FAD-dependent oxidoreductase [Paraburkholderia caballeronis]TDV24790.1 cyclic nucleotide-regulated FAD-dependent pyridine nucleotide-disulfide oxidoreductase [Paraburkholderia caballeronis]